MRPVLAAVAGAMLLGGIVVVVSGFPTIPGPLGSAPRSRSISGRQWWHRRGSSGRGLSRSWWARARWAIAAVAGLVVWLVSGWLVGGLITAVTVVGLPVLLSTSRNAGRAIDRIEAVEAWTRHLADVLITGTGLEQAIAVTVRTTPAPIRAEVAALAARLSAHWSTQDALYAFAHDLDDATADLVVASLLLASRRRGPGLARVLAAVADSVADEVGMRRKVEAERAKPRATARAVTIITLAVVGVGAVNGTYSAPYRTPLGQLVLACIAGIFILALVWMRALTLTTPTPRFLSLSNGSTEPDLPETSTPSRTPRGSWSR